MGQIGQPVRRYTVIPLEEPVLPTAEPVIPRPPSKSPDKAPPVTKPEPQPARQPWQGKVAPHDHGPWQNELAKSLKREGLRVGEIIAYRAWRVISPLWPLKGDNRLRSVAMRDYIWHPNEPASGDVRTHGIYSFRGVIRSREEYGYDLGVDEPLLFGKVKIWGEIVEHQEGYRSEFGKIASLDYGDPELLEKFRRIYLSCR